jgi:hypothetical protein
MLENDVVIKVPEISTVQFSKSNSFSNISRNKRAPAEAKRPTIIA